MSGVIAVFDFDHTIIDANSDVVLRDLLPEEVLQTKKMKGLRPSWTAYMAEVFRQLPLAGIDREKVRETCRNLVSNPGIYDLFHYLRDIDAETVILSDANSEIIAAWLDHNLADSKFEIITNPATWGEDGVLKVRPYQHQTACKQCPINLCKGSVLTKYLEGKEYRIVVYVGDGKNDLCPAQKLRTCDLVCPRSKYQLQSLLEKTPIDAKVCVWETATTIKVEIDKILD